MIFTTIFPSACIVVLAFVRKAKIIIHILQFQTMMEIICIKRNIIILLHIIIIKIECKYILQIKGLNYKANKYIQKY